MSRNLITQITLLLVAFFPFCTLAAAGTAAKTEIQNELDVSIFVKGKFPDNQLGSIEVFPHDSPTINTYSSEQYQIVVSFTAEKELVLDRFLGDETSFLVTPSYAIYSNKSQHRIRCTSLPTGSVAVIVEPGVTSTSRIPGHQKSAYRCDAILKADESKVLNLPSLKLMEYRLSQGLHTIDFEEGDIQSVIQDQLASNQNRKRNVITDFISTPSSSAAAYNQQTYLLAHNAMASAEDGWSDPQQTHGIHRQVIDHGVRAFEVDAIVYGGTGVQTERGLYLCHEDCHQTGVDIGLQRLRKFSDFLSELIGLLDANPEMILTVFVELPFSLNEETNRFLMQALLESGALKSDHTTGKWISRVYWPARVLPGQPAPTTIGPTLINGTPGDASTLQTGNVKQTPSDRWPTVGEMIQQDKRLVIFTSRAKYYDGSSEIRSVLPYTWEYVRETQYSDQGVIGSFYQKGVVKTLLGIDEYLERAESEAFAKRSVKSDSRSLVRMNHFPPITWLSFLPWINSSHELQTRTVGYVRLFGQLPNFIALDMVEKGSAQDFIDLLNQKCWKERGKARVLGCVVTIQEDNPLTDQKDEL